MLVVKIEVWPGGDPDRAYEIGRAAAANVSDLRATSDYVVVTGNDRGEHSQGMVVKHRRSLGFWPLVAAIADIATSTAQELEDSPKLASVREKFEKMPAELRKILARKSDPAVVDSFHEDRDQETMTLFSRFLNQ